ncbi:hypothetical protein [Chryseobacterium lineare]
MKNILTTAAVLFGMTAFAQVGINNTSPKSTLDITAKTGGTRPEGLIIPQLTGDQIRAATTATPTPVYGSDQKGLIIYATTADSAPAGPTANITAPGYYYFDGSIWQMILGSSSGDTTNDSWTNDTTNAMVKIGTKADGTARDAGTDVVVTDTGNVGIGTATPKEKLNISYNNATSALTSSSLKPGILLTGQSGTVGDGPGLYFEGQNNNTGTRVFKFNLIKDSSGDGILNFRSISDDGVWLVKSIMSLTSKGYVGIGTEVPKSILHANTPTSGGLVDAGIFSIDNCGSGCSQATARNIVLSNKNLTSGTFAYLDFVPSADPTAASGASIRGIDRDATNNYAGLSFYTRNATDFNPRLAIKSSGRVGIGAGAESPNATLDVKAASDGSTPEGIIAPRLSLAALQGYTYNSAQTGAIVYVTPATGTPTGQTANVTAVGYYYFDGSAWQKILNTSSGDTTNDAWTNDTTNTMVKLGTKADGTARAAGTDFVVKDTGNVGIGTSSPSAKLELNSGTTNTSGLKFTNLNSSTPTSSGTTLGVDASGNIVTVQGSAFVPATGKSVLTATTNIAANGANYNLTSITLPTAGTYLVTYTVRGEIQVTGGNGWLTGFLSTLPSAGNIVTDTEILITTSTDASRAVIGGTATGTYIATVTNPTTYYLGIKAVNIAGVVFNNSDGRTFVSYVKVTP